MNAEYKINGNTIETERMLLRPFTQEDLEDLFAYASVEGVGEMAGWRHHPDREESQRILDMFIEEDKVYAICLKESNRVVGTVGVEFYGREEVLTEFASYKGREIGFVLAKDCWGRGLMPEAVTAVIKHLFEEVDLDFLICSHFNYNTQSRSVQHKVGFRPYRKVVTETMMDTKEESTLNLLLNPNKELKLEFSHPETLIWQEA